MKYLIFDSGPIISFAMNGVLPLLEKLKENFNGEFVITPQVKREVIDRPLKIKKYKLEAIQIKNLVDKGVIKISSHIMPLEKLEKETAKILKITNSYLRTTRDKQKIKLIQEGEASCLAFANLCSCNHAIVVDERTTRLLTEAPEKLRKLMERKLHTPLEASNDISSFKNFKFIRSPELVYIAYKKGLIEYGNGKDVLDALLYSMKFKGAAISKEEIEEIKSLV